MTDKRTATLGEFFEELKRDLELDPNMALERVSFEYCYGTFDLSRLTELEEKLEEAEGKIEDLEAELRESELDCWLRQDIENLCDMLEDLEDDDDLDEVRALAHDISRSL